MEEKTEEAVWMETVEEEEEEKTEEGVEEKAARMEKAEENVRESMLPRFRRRLRGEENVEGKDKAKPTPKRVFPYPRSRQSACGHLRSQETFEKMPIHGLASSRLPH